jgi:molecular chaperone DnaK
MTMPTENKPNLSKWSICLAYGTGRVLRVIPKDTPLPAQRALTVTTMADKQENIGLSIVLGEQPTAIENYALSNIKLDGIELKPKGEARVALTFYVYTNGIINIGVKYKPDDAEQKLTIIPSSGLSRDDVAQLQKKYANYVEEPPAGQEQIKFPDLPEIPLPPI